MIGWLWLGEPASGSLGEVSSEYEWRQGCLQSGGANVSLNLLYRGGDNVGNLTA